MFTSFSTKTYNKLIVITFKVYTLPVSDGAFSRKGGAVRTYLEVPSYPGRAVNLLCLTLDSSRIADHLENAARNACGWIYVHRENLALLGR